MLARFETDPEVKTSAASYPMKVGEFRLKLDDTMIRA